MDRLVELLTPKDCCRQRPAGGFVLRRHGRIFGAHPKGVDHADGSDAGRDLAKKRTSPQCAGGGVVCSSAAGSSGDFVGWVLAVLSGGGGDRLYGFRTAILRQPLVGGYKDTLAGNVSAVTLAFILFPTGFIDCAGGQYGGRSGRQSSGRANGFAGGVDHGFSWTISFYRDCTGCWLSWRHCHWPA